MPAVPTICLPRRQLFEITDASTVRIRCTAGSLWITLDHDTRDVILQPGDSFIAAEPRRMLLYAFEPSAFALEPTDQRTTRVAKGASAWTPPTGVWAAARAPGPG